MQSTTPAIRRWWRNPRSLREREEDRRVSFLELFYDLVYVVVIAEISHHLAGHAGVAGILEAAFLFVLVWIAWINGTMYHDLHGQNDIRTRVFTFAQMFTVAAMAVFAHSAFGEGAAGFGLAFATYLVLLGYLWWRTGVDPHHRPLSRPYAVTFVVAALLFGASAFVLESWQLGMWAIGLLLILAIPLWNVVFPPTDPDVQAELARTRDLQPSLVERFGLFTIIVLGEVIIGVVQGLAEHHHLDETVFLTAGLGMLLAIGLWWLYFDFISHRLPLGQSAGVFAWIYLHLPMTMGIMMVGSMTLNVVEHAGEPIPPAVRWLLVSALGLAMAGIALLMRSIRVAERLRPFYDRGSILTLVAAGVVVMAGTFVLPTMALLIGLNILLLLPALYGIHTWIHVFDAETEAFH